MARSLMAAYGPTNKELKGIEVEFVLDSTPGNELSIFMLCRRAGGSNAAYKARIEKVTRPHRGKLQATGSLPEALALQIYVQTYGETVVSKWWTVEAGEERSTVPFSADEELPFSSENFVRLMKACPDMFDQLRMQVTGPDNFREDDLVETDDLGFMDPQADAKNS